MNMKQIGMMIGLGVSVGAAASATAGNVVWNQGFETDTAGWFDETNGWTGVAERVASGTSGIASSSGSYHAHFSQTNTPGVGLGAPYSRFDGYRDTWPGGMTASIDIYLDTGWADGEGFDYSVAGNQQAGSHLRDFIFHVTKDTSTGKLLVGGSNNSNFAPREDLENLNHYEVTASGWFTFEHVFRDAGDGSLAVDLVLRDSDGNVVFVETRNNGADLLASVVGGNRYSWFTHINIGDGLHVDNHMLTIIPLPAASAMAGLGLVAVGARRRRRV